MSIELVMLSKHLILCYPLLLLPSVFPSIRVFSNELAPHRVVKVYRASATVNKYPGLISSRTDWFDFLAVQGTLKSLLPTPQFESTNSLALSLLYDPALTSVPDYWKNHSLDYMDFCWQSSVSVLIRCLGLSQLFSKE